MTDFRMNRRTLLAATGAAALASQLPLSGSAAAAPPAFSRSVVRRWARDTWRSLVAMTDPRTGLTSDQIPSTLTGRVPQSSPTNFGGYLWSTVVARDLGIITPGEAVIRCRKTLNAIARLEKDAASGMFYNWYDVRDGSVLRQWPGTTPPDGTVVPFVSSVDNAWLGAALVVVRAAVPAVAKLADRIFESMRWDAFYDPNAWPAGLIHGGFWTETPPPGASYYVGNHIGVGPDVYLTNHHYDTCVSETRMTTYLGIATGMVPAVNYYNLWRTFNLDWTWQEMKPVGEVRTYLGKDVFEGAYTYRGMHIVPGWGGSMFEELMPDMFVDEASWAPNSWGVNHPLHVRAQREHGLLDAGYGYWGFSPSMDPYGGYREYGLDMLGLNPTGYFSDEEKTDYDVGYPPDRAALNPNPTYGDGVVTPHASFLAMMHERDEAFANLVKIQTQLKAYGPGGFFDAAAPRSGKLARVHLSLDQSMVLGAIGNVLGGDIVRNYFSPGLVERNVRPVIAPEVFSAGLV